jgi:hypothetical protein
MIQGGHVVVAVDVALAAVAGESFAAASSAAGALTGDCSHLAIEAYD